MTILTAKVNGYEITADVKDLAKFVFLMRDEREREEAFIRGLQKDLEATRKTVAQLIAENVELSERLQEAVDVRANPTNSDDNDDQPRGFPAEERQVAEAAT